MDIRDGAEAPIVGIGASAGGLEALSLFFNAMPPNTGLVFIVVVHLDPTHQSQLSSLLARQTAMPVVDIQDGMALQINHVYIIVPDRDLVVEASALRLVEPVQPRGHRHPVDVLFKSLAEQKRERAIAVVLSGTGTNGTQGLRDIRANGGLILIQDTRTAKFDGMPRSAISAGLADHVLAPGQMPITILSYLEHGYITSPGPPVEPPLDDQAQLNKVLAFLRSYSAENFRSYKPATLLRRITRRMSFQGIQNIDQYIAILKNHPMEIEALAADLLISVTGFFRDENAWAALEKLVVAPLISSRQAGEAIRIWVPACSTGEEPYSIAMMVIENAEHLGKHVDLKIFASDLIESNLSVARAGTYVSANVESLPPARIERFFEKVDGFYRVRGDLRDRIVFARQDILCDPPFSRMDLITCRNLLIYIKPEAQNRVLSLFHFALRDDSYLFLGSAETVGRSNDLFETLSKKWRIYRRLPTAKHGIARFPSMSGSRSQPLMPENIVSLDESPRISEIVRRVLLERYAPTSVLIDQKGRILFFNGNTSEHLKQPSGEPTLQLLAMIHGKMLVKMRRALSRAVSNFRSVEFTVEIPSNGAGNAVRVAITPISMSPSTFTYYLITFERHEVRLANHHDAVGDEIRDTSSSMAHELAVVRAELQSAIEQLQSSNEEMKASHEEANSINEELQSTNEELESSKEELQSFNEELHSVNTELQHKIAELEEVTNDLSNLLSGTEIATVFLDKKLRIKWFSPAIKVLFDLEITDIGRPISSFSRKFSDADLLADAEIVLEDLTPIEIEISGNDEKWFSRRVLPYRARDDRILGIVITFVDITERRRAERAESYRTINHELELRVEERTSEVERANRSLLAEMAARRRSEDQMEFLAHNDQLTEIPNRLQLKLFLPKLVEQTRVANSQMALLYLDLDRFKPINDMFGHAAGDHVLQIVARKLKSVVRPTDVVARLGGDEFVVGICDIDGRTSAETLAIRIIETLGKSIEIENHEVPVGVSIGIALAPADSSEPEQLLQNADMALYEAKRAGGNTWRFFKEEMAHERVQRMFLEADLRNAVVAEEFSLLYQPIVDAISDRIVGFEALLRWNHPSRGLLSPTTFIKIAEESGLIVQIGRWALNKACSDATLWPEDLSVAVNLSGIQVRDPSIQSVVQEALIKTGLAARRLELEITESVLLEENAENLQVINNLRQLGLLVAMDDFGTGYSSLNHLLKFPYGKIKLDLSLIRNIEDDDKAVAVVKAILALGQALQMMITAEGVETEAQLSILKRIRCPQVQGHLLGYPIQADEIPALLSAGRIQGTRLG